MADKLRRPETGWPIARVADALGPRHHVSDAALAALGGWLDLLVAWNARVDLTAARSSDELIDLMIADAVVLSAHIPTGARVIDVGTGAGAPGLALSVLRRDLHVTLVEPLAKRAAFLRTVLGTLQLSGVTLDARKGATVAATHPRAWDVALARATLPPLAWLELAGRLIDDDGRAWAFLAKESTPEDPSFAVAAEVAYAWPLTGAARRLVCYAPLPRLPGARPEG